MGTRIEKNKMMEKKFRNKNCLPTFKVEFRILSRPITYNFLIGELIYFISIAVSLIIAVAVRFMTLIAKLMH